MRSLYQEVVVEGDISDDSERWKLGSLHDDGSETFWEWNDGAGLVDILKSAYMIIEEQPYHPVDCPEKVALWERNACGRWDLKWTEDED